MSFFISDAVASAGAPSQGSPYSLIIMLVVFGDRKSTRLNSSHT